MRKVLIWFVLPASILGTLGVPCAYTFLGAAQSSTWKTSLWAEAAAADRLVVHDMDFYGKGPQPDCEDPGSR